MACPGIAPAPEATVRRSGAMIDIGDEVHERRQDILWPTNDPTTDEYTRTVAATPGPPESSARHQQAPPELAGVPSVDAPRGARVHPPPRYRSECRAYRSTKHVRCEGV